MTKRSVDSAITTDDDDDMTGDDPTTTTTTTRRPPKRGSLSTLLSRETPFPNEEGALPNGEFEPDRAEEKLAAVRVLVVGAGGLGCEILKNLAMSGVRKIDVIDLDTIDVTNLNRQFLFRMKDVGGSKAKVAAAFVRKRCPWVDVTAHHGAIQDFDADFYKNFDCVVSGLDNIEARRWLNSLLCGLVEEDEDGDVDPETIIPMIDGGSEGFKGQARVIIPKITSCFECTLDMFPPQQTFPLCTIAETPRKPEHCVAYASMILWDREFPDKKLDNDSPVDMRWVYEKAKERAETYGIPGVTYNLTMGVVKNIIPAVASTNAIVAAVCANEVVKLLTYCSQTLNTYTMYNGSQGIYAHTFIAERKPDCLVSAAPTLRRTLSRRDTLQTLLENLKTEPTRLRNPSATTGSKTLYMSRPAALERATKGNLDAALGDLVDDGEKITITDEALAHTALTLTVRFEG